MVCECECHDHCVETGDWRLYYRIVKMPVLVKMWLLLVLETMRTSTKGLYAPMLMMSFPLRLQLCILLG